MYLFFFFYVIMLFLTQIYMNGGYLMGSIITKTKKAIKIIVTVY